MLKNNGSTTLSPSFSTHPILIFSLKGREVGIK
jgi:hypothetical protein